MDYYGPNCSYTSATQCNNRGIPDLPGGECRCNDPDNVAGPHCEYTRDYCNDHGSPRYEDGNVGCNCDDGYEGDTCETTSACSHPSAELEDLSSGRVYCQNGGQPTGTTEDCGCNCFNGAVGPKCEYTIDDCNSNGTPFVIDGNLHCTCDEGGINSLIVTNVLIIIMVMIVCIVKLV